MEYNEAKLRLKGHFIVHNDGRPTPLLDEAVRMTYEALEKQIPKKPKKYIAFDGIKRNGCPTCNHNEILYGGQRYCSVCGQRIDWSEVE